MALTIAPEHGYVILSSAAICLYGAIAGGMYVGPSRSKTFNKEWYESKVAKELAETHKKEVGSDFPKGGYPDMGSGRFASTLSYAQWYAFNNAQRAHYNLIEGFAPILGLHILSGIFFPKITAASSLVWILARHTWSTNYIKSGANARYNGVAGLHALCAIGWLGATIFGGLKLTGLLKL